MAAVCAAARRRFRPAKVNRGPQKLSNIRDEERSVFTGSLEIRACLVETSKQETVLLSYKMPLRRTIQHKGEVSLGANNHRGLLNYFIEVESSKNIHETRGFCQTRWNSS